MRDRILTSLTGMALSKKEFLESFRRQEYTIWGHLIKILTIASDSEWHWIDEIDSVFEGLCALSCKSNVTEKELKNTFKSYDISDGKDWIIIAGYCGHRNNLRKSVRLYESGLKPCELIPEIMEEFFDRLLKGASVVKLESLKSFKKALKLRSLNINLFTLKQVLKLKNKIWEK